MADNREIEFLTLTHFQYLLKLVKNLKNTFKSYQSQNFTIDIYDKFFNDTQILLNTLTYWNWKLKYDPDWISVLLEFNDKLLLLNDLSLVELNFLESEEILLIVKYESVVTMLRNFEKNFKILIDYKADFLKEQVTVDLELNPENCTKMEKLLNEVIFDLEHYIFFTKFSSESWKAIVRDGHNKIMNYDYF